MTRLNVVEFVVGESSTDQPSRGARTTHAVPAGLSSDEVTGFSPKQDPARGSDKSLIWLLLGATIL